MGKELKSGNVESNNIKNEMTILVLLSWNLIKPYQTNQYYSSYYIAGRAAK